MERKYNRELKQRNRVKTIGIFGLLFFLLVMIFVFVVYPIFTYKVHTYQINNNKLPTSFEGYKIMQISDLYMSPYTKLNQIEEIVNSSNPDIIVMTGNNFTEEDEGYYKNFVDFKKKINQNILIYVVKGETELSLSKEYSESLFKGLQKIGVYLLDDRKVSVNSGGQTINLHGVTPDKKDYEVDNDNVAHKPTINLDKEKYNVVLSHNPSYSDYLSLSNSDLILSGNRNGGWIRLPFVNGISYDSESKYKEDDYILGSKVVLLVSRGAGTKSGKFRLFNQREIIEIILKR